ncbi:MAG: glycosyltransferase [Synechococcales cyanobacterium CRU_2_2]|nr:glycosyltransferase [Synechococcales cyanobacterium CRU_2_2]
MRILFLDQSGELGGAELCLLDLASRLSSDGLVALLADGPFAERLRQAQIPVQVLQSQATTVRKNSRLWQGIAGGGPLLLPAWRAGRLAQQFDLIYANTPKALIVGAIAHILSRRPLVYHLHDILSDEHFSQTNLNLLVFLANRFASLVIANSEATRTAFVEAGGNAGAGDGQRDRCPVVYNGFDPAQYVVSSEQLDPLRCSLNLPAEAFIIGHFSRLSPWKGQHILLEALAQCPEQVVALLVGDALFGEDEYVQQLHQQVARLGLEGRVKFLGFRSDIPALMHLCDLVAHTSTAPEPFGRVIVEAMLCGTPVVAARAGGAVELIEPGRTGWLTEPGNAAQLAGVIQACLHNPQEAREGAIAARTSAYQHFGLDATCRKINHLLDALAAEPRHSSP